MESFKNGKCPWKVLEDDRFVIVPLGGSTIEPRPEFLAVKYATRWGPVQTPNFSWAEPNSNKGRPKSFRPAELIQTPILILTKYVIWTYAFGSVHEKVGVWIKAVPKFIQSRNSRSGQAGRTAELFQIEPGVPNWFRRRTFYVLVSMY